MKIINLLLISLIAFFSMCSCLSFWQPKQIDLSKSEFSKTQWTIKIKVNNNSFSRPGHTIFNKVDNELLIFIDGNAIANHRAVNLQNIKNKNDVMRLVGRLNEYGIFNISNSRIELEKHKAKTRYSIIDGIDILLFININNKEFYYDMSNINYFRQSYPEIQELQYLYKCYEVLIEEIPEMR